MSPLILGSSLIVLLVLIVVVTLLRQRGAAEEAYPDEPSEEEEERAWDETEDPDLYEDVEVRNPYHREEGREGFPAVGGERPDAGRRNPEERARPGAVTAAAAAAATTVATGVVAGGAAAGVGPAPDDEAGEPAGRRPVTICPSAWTSKGKRTGTRARKTRPGSARCRRRMPGVGPGSAVTSRSASSTSSTSTPTRATDSFPDLSADPEEEDDPETGAGPGRRE